MNTTKIDISTLNRIELAELRDEIVFELDLHDAELRAFYGTTRDGAMLGAAHPEEEVWCPVCEDRDGDEELLRDGINNAISTLTNGDKGLEERIEAAISDLEDAL